jgi:Flp pilus assembly protein TadG
MILKHRSRARRRGTAVVESALLLPLLLLLLLGVWEVGRLIEVSQVLDNAVREGARQASTGQLSNDDVKIAVCAYLKEAGLPDYTSVRNTVVTVTDVTSPGTDVSNATQLDQLQVSISIPFSDVRWVPLYLVTNASSTLNAQAYWYSLKDKDYPTVVDPPIE